jgi:hypothetical protein
MTMIAWNMRRHYVLRGFYDWDDPPMRWEKKPPRPPKPDFLKALRGAAHHVQAILASLGQVIAPVADRILAMRPRALLAKVWRLYVGLEPKP